jgi:hypothetical protein
MRRHPFDPISFILGASAAAFGAFFLFGDASAADVGWDWIWPLPLILLGLLFVVSAGRRMLPSRETELVEGDAATTTTEELPLPDAEDV